MQSVIRSLKETAVKFRALGDRRERARVLIALRDHLAIPESIDRKTRDRVLSNVSYFADEAGKALVRSQGDEYFLNRLLVHRDDKHADQNDLEKLITSLESH